MSSTSPLDLISTLAINCGEAYSSPCIILIEITTTSEAIDLELKLGMMNARVFGAGDNKDSRETVVLAHGYGSSQFIWDDVVPTLAARFQVVVFDWSFSAAADGKRYCCSYSGLTDELVALMDELRVRNATFVGHFMAGMLGCIASVARPDLFSHLVLVGASPRSGQQPCTMHTTSQLASGGDSTVVVESKWA
jgi:pimeloyl-ACP methyl ester carboxylesterase